MRQIVLLALVLAALLASVRVAAHEMRPGYLKIQQVSAERFETMWRVPARGDLRLGIYLEMPPNCELAGELLTWTDGEAFVDQGVFDCAGGLVGHGVRIAGLESLMTDALARYERLDGTSQVVRLTPADPAFLVTESESWRQVASAYFVLGVEHILLGIDHLLFVLALLLLVGNLRTLFWTITAFTLAHSLTLAGATLGWVNAPQQPVEAVIALSILFVAMEIIHARQGRAGLTQRWPWLVAFVFGLLHGFGFAGALSEIGLPEHAIPLSLLFFNLGVEAGQLLFVAGALLVWIVFRRLRLPSWTRALPVYAIGSLAAFWTIERTAGFIN
ncbi:MAG: HupE/UreJ family protein [Xanthomonadales bacterium]|nr:HupE/UreJ family protein [Xanthomonadales bacterium]